MMHKPKSLKDLLLVHELIFIVLIILAVTAGALGISLWDKSSQESQRINFLIQEIQQTRGDLYRQMKELFDAFFLDDKDALAEYDQYTKSIEQHFVSLKKLAVGKQEVNAIFDLQRNYHTFVTDTPLLFYSYQASPNAHQKKLLYKDMETGIFSSYETVSARTEKLLSLKQGELKAKLKESKSAATALLGIPIVLAILLLFFSRLFIKRSIVRPIDDILYATTEISLGHLNHKVPETGAAELATLSHAINKMATDLSSSQDALVRTEKQAAMGLLVPMLAHNIRNPLASIRATAQVVDSSEQDADTREALHGIMDTVDRLERWTGSLLAYLHPIKPQLKVTELRHILQGALAPLQQKIRDKSLVIDFSHILKHQHSILTDEHLLEQVLYNLLLNAIDASPKAKKIEISVSSEADKLSIVIADKGAGMPFIPDPHAISPGPTTKRFGTGLGIPFAFKVCEVLGGDLQFKQNSGGGTLVTLTLPWQDATSATY